jgi:hypothetical protein
MTSKTASFPDYIRSNLQNNNYKCTMQTQAGDLFMQTPDGESVWIAYLAQEWTVEQIRRCFEFKGHVLFVVDDKLIPQEITDRQSTPMWLRVLHGLYLGRIYVWNDRFLFGLHFDYDTGDISESGIIQPDELLLIETGTWLRGWTGEYKLARFYDRAWWTDDRTGFYNYTDQKARQQYDNTQRQRENKQSYGYYGGTGSNPPKQDATGGRDFGREFRACDDLMAVKALYRKLAQEYHPDLNPGNDTTAIMQAINAAYDRAKMVHA